jgi:hypothetical protein
MTGRRFASVAPACPTLIRSRKKFCMEVVSYTPLRRPPLPTAVARGEALLHAVLQFPVRRLRRTECIASQ